MIDAGNTTVCIFLSVANPTLGSLILICLLLPIGPITTNYSLHFMTFKNDEIASQIGSVQVLVHDLIDKAVAREVLGLVIRQ